jgi:hypothetical protein
MEPTGSVRLGYGTLAEKESSCAFPVMGNQWSSNNDITSRNRRVTDPYDRWCGGRRFNPSSYPIRQVATPAALNLGAMAFGFNSAAIEVELER